MDYYADFYHQKDLKITLFKLHIAISGVKSMNITDSNMQLSRDRIDSVIHVLTCMYLEKMVIFDQGSNSDSMIVQ